jgi:hypothetical protein
MSGTDRQSPRAASVIPTALAIVAFAISAVWINLGTFHRLENGDSVLPILMSLYRWSPFLWEQNRFGMLLPLLAMPIRHPLANLLFQRTLFLASAMASFGLIARYALGARAWPLVGLLGATVFVGLMQQDLSFGYLGDEPYAVALTLGLWALLLVDTRSPGAGRIAAAAVLLVLGHWVNLALLLLLLPLVGARALASLAQVAREQPEPGGWRRHPVARMHALQAGLVLLGGLVGWVVARTGPNARATRLNPVSPADWPAGWAALVRNTWSLLESHGWPCALAAAAAAGLALLAWPRWRTAARAGVERSAALVLVFAFYFAAVGSLSWTKINDYDPRYLEPGFIAVQAGLLGLLLVPLVALLSERAHRTAVALTALALAATGALRYGTPSLAGVRRDIEAISPEAAEVVEARCTHVVGTYWTVWPAVFVANLTWYERGERRVVWGFTHRAWPTWDLAMAVPREQMRIAAPLNDPKTPQWLETYQLPPLVEVERRSRIAVLRPVPAASH